MAEEDARDRTWGETSYNGVEEGSGVRKWIGPIVARKDVSDDPSLLTTSLTGCELICEEFENTAGVGVGTVPVVEDVGFVPEVRVNGDYTEALGRCVCVGGIVSGCILSFSCIDPGVVLPEGREKLVVPGHSIGGGGTAWVQTVLSV